MGEPAKVVMVSPDEWRCLPRRAVSWRIKKRLGDAQGWRCLYCDCRVSLTASHADHVVPIRRGGADEYANLALACPSCNLDKHISSVADFIGLQAARLDERWVLCHGPIHMASHWIAARWERFAAKKPRRPR